LFTSVNSSPETANAGFTTTRLLSDQAAPRNIHRIDRPLLFQTIDFITNTVTIRGKTFTVRANPASGADNRSAKDFVILFVPILE
jgi:hypothetical protein